MRKLSVLSICIVLVFGLSFTSSVMASDEDDALQVVKDLIQSVDDWDMDFMSSLYLKSPEISYFGPKKDGAFLTRGYEAMTAGNEGMENFPKGAITWSIYNPQVTMMGDKAAVIASYAIVTVNPPLVEQQVVDQLRLTLVVQKVGGKWLIVHQHESFLPTE